MLIMAAYWLFILLTAAGKLLAFVVLVVFAIALPISRVQMAKTFGRATVIDVAIASFGVVGVFVLLENIRIFLIAF